MRISELGLSSFESYAIFTFNGLKVYLKRYVLCYRQRIVPAHPHCCKIRYPILPLATKMQIIFHRSIFQISFLKFVICIKADKIPGRTLNTHSFQSTGLSYEIPIITKYSREKFTLPSRSKHHHYIMVFFEILKSKYHFSDLMLR